MIYWLLQRWGSTFRPCSTVVTSSGTKGLIGDTEQRAWVLNELKHTTVPDKPALLQLGCLRVPLFACPLCHEMEGAGDCVRVEMQIPFVFEGMLVTEVLSNVHADFDRLG